MGTLSAESASQKRSKYISYIDDVIYDINQNFNEMILKMQFKEPL